MTTTLMEPTPTTTNMTADINNESSIREVMTVNPSPTSLETAGAPRLKLTFKLSEIRAASPVENNTTSMPIASDKRLSDSSTATEKSPEHRKSKKKKTKQASLADNTENLNFALPFKKTSTSTNNSTINSTSKPVNKPTTLSTGTSLSAMVGRASSKVVFPELIELVANMRRYRARSWAWQPATLSLLGTNRNLSLKTWTQDPSIPSPFQPAVEDAEDEERNHTDATATTTTIRGQTHNNLDDKPSTAASSKGIGLLPTFVCPLEGCHRIYDDQEKWKRHQVWHRKKLRRLERERQKMMQQNQSTLPSSSAAKPAQLQLKLNVGAMKRAASTETTANNSEPAVMTEEEEIAIESDGD